MRSTFKILPYINKKRIKPDGTCAVLCRVSIDGKNILITTGITCRPEDWDSKKGGIRTARENNRLAEFRQNLERTYDRLLKEQGAVSAELLKNAVTGVARIPQTLLQGGEAEERLLSYPWPGNIREMQNRVRRAVLLAESPLVGTEELDLPDGGTSSLTGGIHPHPKGDAEWRSSIEKALALCGGHRGHAAALLHVSEATLYRKMKKYGVK